MFGITSLSTDKGKFIGKVYFHFVLAMLILVLGFSLRDYLYDTTYDPIGRMFFMESICVILLFVPFVFRKWLYKVENIWGQYLFLSLSVILNTIVFWYLSVSATFKIMFVGDSVALFYKSFGLSVVVFLFSSVISIFLNGNINVLIRIMRGLGVLSFVFYLLSVLFQINEWWLFFVLLLFSIFSGFYHMNKILGAYKDNQYVIACLGIFSSFGLLLLTIYLLWI